MKIAVIGAGISGLGAAWALGARHDVTVYEASRRLGGHANTVDVRHGADTIAVDTGFIVYNTATYPHLTRLFDALDVPTAPSDMSFSFSREGDLEYGASLRGLLAQPSALLRSRHRAMLRDIARFRNDGPRLLARSGDRSIGDLLDDEGYSTGFLRDYLLPMTGAIWSSAHSQVFDFPARTMLTFLSNHGLIRIAGRPKWRTVHGGSREYVTRLAAALTGSVLTGATVSDVIRSDAGVVIRADGVDREFDQVVMATHTDVALRLLGADATPREEGLLRSIPYIRNEAVLHGDTSLMPSRRRAWASWNAVATGDGGAASITYWMNRLQGLDASAPLFVSLNPVRQPSEACVHARLRYDHPGFGPDAPERQAAINEIQGERRTWYAGAWLGYGFHEDGLQSGLNVAAALGSPAPWHDRVVPMSSAPAPVALARR